MGQSTNEWIEKEMPLCSLGVVIARWFKVGGWWASSVSRFIWGILQDVTR